MTKKLSKQSQHKLVCLTAHDERTAMLLDESADVLLIVDSLSLLLSDRAQIAANIDIIIDRAQLVCGKAHDAFTLVQLPVKNNIAQSALRFLETIDHIINIAGPDGILVDIELCVDDQLNPTPVLTRRNAAIVAYIRQQIPYARLPSEVDDLIASQAIAAEQHGAVAVVLSGLSESLLARLTAMLTIPTISVGPSQSCDGQLLFTELYFGNEQGLASSIAQLCLDMRNGRYPTNILVMGGSAALS